MKRKTIYLNGENLSIQNVIDISENNYQVDFSNGLREKISKGRKLLEKQINEHPEIPIYGTNRLHGDLKDKDISLDLIKEYQKKYIKVHNCGTGKALDIKVSRAIMVIRLNSFAKCLSGIKLDTCELMLNMLNRGVTPLILEEGSVGASGDLIPLAMIGAVLIALPEAEAYFEGRLLPAKTALDNANLKAVELGAKEAMGLTNGSNFISALSVFAIKDTENLIKTASVSAALSLEAIRGEKKAFCKLINDNSRKHKGQTEIAKQIRFLIDGSERMTKKAQEIKLKNQSESTVGERVQDRYSFRAVPQVHGVVVEALDKLKETLEIEINSATDNPLFDFNKKDVNTGGIYFASGANFHGQALATVIDYLKIAITSIALMSDKRSFSMLDRNISYGLPADLAKNTDKADGGLMITQYSGASRAAECRILSTPSSVMSISTSANQEDFVSMGSIGVLHLKKIIYNTEIVLSIELLCALRGIQLTKKELEKFNISKLGKINEKAYKILLEKLGDNTNDKYLRDDMNTALAVLKSEKFKNLFDN